MKMHRIVIKIGTHVITGDNGLLNRAVMKSLVQQVIELKSRKIEVILVSSGAVAAGRSCLGSTDLKSEAIHKRQILASVGQVKFMEIYSEFFQKGGYHCAQVLATKEDFRDRHHYLCMRECFISLLHDDIVPVVNENDVVAVDELMFTDNDELAGLIASMLDADAVLLLTNVEGLYDRDPNDKSAKLIKTIPANSRGLDQYAPPHAEKSTFGRGGIHTKCRVAKRLASLGITTHIVDGKRSNVLLDVVSGKGVGTTFEPQKRASGIKKWIAHAEGQEKGYVTINECAETLLKAEDRARSLLPVGITKVVGKFDKGDIVEIHNTKGKTMGYGIAQYGSDSALEKMGQKNKKPLVHYDYLFLYP